MATKKKTATAPVPPTLAELSARVDSLAARLRAVERVVRPDDTFATHLARKLRGAADKKDPYRRKRAASAKGRNEG
jgi:hypothetical protein